MLQEIEEQVNQTNQSPQEKYSLAKQEAFKLYLTGKLSKVMVVNICAGIISAYLAGSENKNNKGVV